MSEWHRLDDEEIEYGTNEICFFVTQNDFGSVYLCATFEQIKAMNKEVETLEAQGINENMGVQCPKCGIEITIDNAGGYRTYCDKCVQDK